MISPPLFIFFSFRAFSFVFCPRLQILLKRSLSYKRPLQHWQIRLWRAEWIFKLGSCSPQSLHNFACLLCRRLDTHKRPALQKSARLSCSFLIPPPPRRLSSAAQELLCHVCHYREAAIELCRLFCFTLFSLCFTWHRTIIARCTNRRINPSFTHVVPLFLAVGCNHIL